MPFELSYIWGWFWELAATRQSHGFGPNPLSYSDIAAWAGLTGVALRASELDAIMMLDRLWFLSYVEARSAQEAWQEQQRQQRRNQRHG
jgi:hypothetical protein